MIGKKLAHYEITALLGKGGMGEVYRARDSKLDREVALKLLPNEFASDPERLARFRREAKVLASLNHANIAGIYGLEDSDSKSFLVMELAEGEDLEDRIQRGAIPVDSAIDIGRQIAQGLEVAHAKGIVHRDLKPANVMIDADGGVKILDFGLARAYTEDSTDDGDMANSPTITAAMTQHGMVLGTAAYMSPEQAKGKAVDRQADIFSFGCVLYECLSGTQAFPGESVTDVLASILRSEPDWDALPSETPSSVRKVIQCCLEKDPRDRLRDIGDVDLLLRDTEEPVATVSPSRNRWLWPTLTGLMAIALVIVLLLGGRDRGSGADLPRITGMSQLTDLPGQQLEPSLSPDGKQLLYATKDGGDLDIFLQRVGGENPINLTANSPGNDMEPAFSPDGERIAFASDRQGGGIFIMGATGETPRRVADAGFGPAWSPDGQKLVYTEEYVIDPYSRLGLANLWVIDLESGEKKRLDDIDAVDPNWSPNGHRIAFWSHLETIQGQRDLWTIDPDGGAPVPVLLDAATDWDPAWSPDGRWLYFVSDRGGSPDLWRIGIDERTGEMRGGPQPVTAGMARVSELSVASTGRVALTSERRPGVILRASFDPVDERLTGELVALHRSAYGFRQMEISRDRQTLAYSTTSPSERIYVMGIDGSGRRKLIDDEYRNRGPSFSPDGSWVVFYSNRSGSYELWAVRSDGTGLRQLTAEQGDVNEPQWTPDDRLTTTIQNPDIWSAEVLLPEGGLEGVAAPCAVERLPGSERFAANSWSPSGQWAVGSLQPYWTLAVYSVQTASVTSIQREGKDVAYESDAAWLDDRRYLFWDNGRDAAFVADRETGEFRQIPGIPGPSVFALGEAGRTLYIMQTPIESDVWLLTLEDTE